MIHAIIAWCLVVSCSFFAVAYQDLSAVRNRVDFEVTKTSENEKGEKKVNEHTTDESIS